MITSLNWGAGSDQSSINLTTIQSDTNHLPALKKLHWIAFNYNY